MERSEASQRDARIEYAKRELRARMSALRRAIPAERRRQRSRQLCEQLVTSGAWIQAQCIVGYIPMRGEADPRAALDAAHAAGKRVALPVLANKTPSLDASALGLEANEFVPDAPLRRNALGFWEPASGARAVPTTEIDFVVVPALAIDPRGARLGFGKGFYDRWLPHLTNAIRVGFIFGFQLVIEVPETSNDQRVELIVTEDACSASKA